MAVPKNVFKTDLTTIVVFLNTLMATQEYLNCKDGIIVNQVKNDPSPDREPLAVVTFFQQQTPE